jgi:Pyruvate/2-oxoacid:ferredoxin oxidoreductase delta subunit
MDRLKLLDAGLRAFDARLPDIVPPLCLVTRYRGSSCRRCLAVCPGDAIVTAPWLRIDPDRCTSCGACAAVCPTGALACVARAEELRVQLAEAQRGDRGEVTVTCRHAAHAASDDAFGEPDPATVVVACLGGLSAADLIAAAASGCTTLRLTSADCEACRERVAGGAAQAAVAAATATLTALGGDLRVIRHRLPGPVHEARFDAPGPAPAAVGLSRRELFAFFSRGTRRTVSEGLAPARRGVADLHGQAPPPASHGRLLDDLRSLGAESAAPGRRLPAALPAALPLATLSAGTSCTGCGLCTRYCPHGALALARADGVLSCDTSRCTGCGLCAETCPPAALELAPAVVPRPGGAGGRSAVVRLWPAP